jgi:hypothetical protein
MTGIAPRFLHKAENLCPTDQLTRHEAAKAGLNRCQGCYPSDMGWKPWLLPANYAILHFLAAT